MIACIETGASIAQGELIAQWDVPHRWAPFIWETTTFARVDVGGGKLLTGHLIESHREAPACPNASS